MIRTTYLLFIIAVLAVGLSACGAETTSTAPGPDQAHEGDDHEGHDHSEGPHGGHVVVLGDHAGHMEMTHGDGGALVIYALDADMKPAAFDEAPVLNVGAGAGSVTVKGVAVAEKGWSFQDDSLMDADVKGRFRLLMGGKTYNSDFDAAEHHDEGHDDDDHDDHEGHDDDDHDDDDHDGHDDDDEGHGDHD